MNRQKYFIFSEESKRQFVEIAKSLPVNKPLMAVIGEAQRSQLQNEIFHAICGDLAKQLKWAGESRTLHQWKLLLISGHSIATGDDPNLVSGIEGEIISLREKTSEMGVKRMSSLIEYSIAFAENSGVKLSAPRWAANER